MILMFQQAGPSDEELLRAMLERDEAAFADLYRRRQGEIYRFALQMSGSAATAEDVTQEVFLTLMREAHKYDTRKGTLRAYLYGITRNKAARAMRNKKEDRLEAAKGPSRGTEGPLEAIQRSQEIRAVWEGVLALPPHYREAVVLCDLHEVSYEEAAQALGCAVGTVRSRLHRGRQLLAQKLRAQAADDVRAAGNRRVRSWSL
ncbi:MAG: RNA polymerase sigma factor [Bryobacteraceae bacterium]|nr:RNA polymerase sigma factor [Bryobacteraceae bacterium]